MTVELPCWERPFGKTLYLQRKAAQGLQKPWPRRQVPGGLTSPGRAPRPQLCSGQLGGVPAGESRQRAWGRLRVLGPRHQDLLQAVDKALQGAVPRRASQGTCKISQGQCGPDRGGSGTFRRSDVPPV